MTSVILTLNGQETPGKVVLSSENRKSIAVFFEGMILGYVGVMPLLWDDKQRCYCDLFHHAEVGVQWLS